MKTQSNHIGKQQVLRLILASVLALVAQSSTPPLATAHPTPPTYQLIVDHDGDESGQACITGIDNDCSLRSAIQVVNAHSSDSYEIVFADNYTVTVSSALPAITTSAGLIIVGRDFASQARTIRINANRTGNVLQIQGSNVTVENLRLYGAGSGWSNIWMTGSAKNVNIANNYIGDPSGMLPCADPTPYGGIYISSSGPLLPSEKRAWIYGNSIACHTGTPGEGITIWGTDGVVIGQDSAGVALGNKITANVIGVAFHAGAHDNLLSKSGITGHSGSGVLLTEGAGSNLIGDPNGMPFLSGNVIASNGWYGIEITGSTTISNVVAGNRIGTDDAGATGQGNNWGGIYVGGLAVSATITGNQVSGNNGPGLWLQNSSAAIVTHNYIGTNISGTAALPNNEDGVRISGSGAQNNLIGGTAPGDGNVISGNSQNGVLMDEGAAFNEFYGNLIGLNADGTAAVANGYDGVRINGSGTQYNRMGGLGSAAQRNFISGNNRNGVLVSGGTRNDIHNNRIGLNAEGTATIPNGWAGVAFEDGASDNYVGGGYCAYGVAQHISGNTRNGIYIQDSSNTQVGQCTSIEGNGGAGVAITVTTGSATGNSIRPRKVVGNGGLPIDLGNDGPTPNGTRSGAGPNNWLPYPTITAASGDLITGTACISCTVFIYQAIGNPAAKGGGGQRWSCSTVANAAGNWNMTTCGMGTAADVSLQACEWPCGPTSNTSELSPRPVLYLPVVLRQ
jgi:parallel beta-helix repeat protein